MKKLSELKIGQKGVIHSISNDEVASVLMELGCLPGEQIVLENKAPFGDPIAIKISGYKLSLRISEAQHVLIEEQS